MRMAKLLNQGNSKTIKGEKYGYKTYGLHFSPANKSGFNVCKWSTAGCRAACLDTAGRGCMSNVQASRIKKTISFFTDRVNFMNQIEKEIIAAIKSAGKKNLIPVFRFNLTSDLPWESIKHPSGKTLMEMFPQVTFYDYTKGLDRMKTFLEANTPVLSWGGSLIRSRAETFPRNYHLTFSRSEETPDSVVKDVLMSDGNVAVVFRGQLPRTFLGYQVVDGDDSDLRFLDGKGMVVGLVEKGLAKQDETGFVVEPKK
jgi:hypothetical protein